MFHSTRTCSINYVYVVTKSVSVNRCLASHSAVYSLLKYKNTAGSYHTVHAQPRPRAAGGSPLATPNASLHHMSASVQVPAQS